MQHRLTHLPARFALDFLTLVAMLALSTGQVIAQETVGGGSLSDPALGPAPAFSLGGDGFTLVKNWNFGENGTVTNYSDLSTHFFYHDPFGTIGNGSNYGAMTVAPDAANAIAGQPIEGINSPTVRQFTGDSLKTLLVPLDGATWLSPSSHNVGNGSFSAKWSLPNGGSHLHQDILWETRVRMVTPAYFWFALWSCGSQWDQGAEIDLVESFGYDNGGGYTNYDGRYWHSRTVNGPDKLSYESWGDDMSASGITSFDATQYHVWTLLYRKDDTYAMYVDGIEVQSSTGSYQWTLGGNPYGTPINLNFLFDGSWGHTTVESVNHSLAASDLEGKYYEWDYSRVYLRAGL